MSEVRESEAYRCKVFDDSGYCIGIFSDIDFSLDFVNYQATLGKTYVCKTEPIRLKGVGLSEM